MHKIPLILAGVMAAAAAHAQQFDLNQLQNTVMSNPQVQQAVGQAVMQNAAKNPAALAGGFASMTPAQTSAFGTQAQAAVAKLLTPSENKSLTTFAASPDGQGIMAKLPEIAQALAPLVMQAYAGNAPAAVAPAAGKTSKAATLLNQFQQVQSQLPLTQPTGGK